VGDPLNLKLHAFLCIQFIHCLFCHTEYYTDLYHLAFKPSLQDGVCIN
jgi:hypothetical protein